MHFRITEKAYSKIYTKSILIKNNIRRGLNSYYDIIKSVLKNRSTDK